MRKRKRLMSHLKRASIAHEGRGSDAAPLYWPEIVLLSEDYLACLKEHHVPGNPSFAFNVTVPNLLMMLLGILLRHWRLMDDRFVDGATRPVFNLALPCLLFFSIATNHPQLLGNLPLVLFGAVGTLATFLLLELAAKWLVKEPRERGCSCRAVSAPIPPSSAPPTP